MMGRSTTTSQPEVSMAPASAKDITYIERGNGRREIGVRVCQLSRKGPRGPVTEVTGYATVPSDEARTFIGVVDAGKVKTSPGLNGTTLIEFKGPTEKVVIEAVQQMVRAADAALGRQ